MKRIFNVLMCMAVMAIASVSCVKETENIQSQDIVIESGVTVAAPSFGVATKAVKMGWEDGDQVMLFFNGDVADGHQMTLTYCADCGEWGIRIDKDVFMSMASEGSFSAVHHDGCMAYAGGAFSRYHGGAVYTQQEGSYKVTRAGSKYFFSAMVDLAVYDAMYQLTVVNAADPVATANFPEVTTEWTLAVLNGQEEPVSDQVVDLFIDAETLAFSNTKGVEAEGKAVANEEGAVAFFPQIIASADDGVYTFVLTDPQGEQWYRTYEKEVGAIAQGSAVKVSWPTGWEPVRRQIEAPELETAEVDSTGRVYDIVEMNPDLAALIESLGDAVLVEGKTEEHMPGEYSFTLTLTDGSVFTNGEEADPTVKTYHWTIGIAIPDPAFKAYCLANFDANGDGAITPAEAAVVTEINCAGASREKPGEIASMEGIQYFTALTKLDCSYNVITSLDLSQNLKLVTLFCSYNQLTSLDLGDNTVITDLTAHVNRLVSLDFNRNTGLKNIYFAGNPTLTSLKFDKCASLRYVEAYDHGLTSVDVSKNTALTHIDFAFGKLTTIDVSKNTALKGLVLYSNQFTSIDVSKNPALESLRIDSNDISELDLSLNPEMRTLYCGQTKLTSLDLTKNPKMKYLYCRLNPQLKEVILPVGHDFNQLHADSTLNFIYK